MFLYYSIHDGVVKAVSYTNHVFMYNNFYATHCLQHDLITTVMSKKRFAQLIDRIKVKSVDKSFFFSSVSVQLKTIFLFL